MRSLHQCERKEQDVTGAESHKILTRDFQTRHFYHLKVSIRFTAHNGQPGAQKHVDWRIQ